MGATQERLCRVRGRLRILITGSSTQPPRATPGHPQTYTPAGTTRPPATRPKQPPLTQRGFDLAHSVNGVLSSRSGDLWRELGTWWRPPHTDRVALTLWVLSTLGGQ